MEDEGEGMKDEVGDKRLAVSGWESQDAKGDRKPDSMRRGYTFRSQVSAAGSGAGIGHRCRTRDQYLNLNT